ncbi:MAG: DnaJ C-terminal domain-containing protein [Desulfovibrio sp.]
MAVEYKDYYKTLGVSKTADKDEISRAFKKLARKCHPDLNPNDKSAEARFKEINEAYEVLKDPEKRKLYDQLGPNWEQYQQGGFQRPPGFENVQFDFGGGAGGFSDFFETIFGGGFGAGGGFPGGGFHQEGFGGRQGYQRRPRRGADSEAVYEITLEEAYRGGQKTITLQEQGGPGMASGQGKTLDVKLPAGVKDGQRIRLSGQGNPGMGGGPAGDLYLKIRILPHHIYGLADNNVLLDLPLAPWEAALGAKVRVPTLDGPVEMNIPAGMASGKKLRVRGRGLGCGGKKGDQIVRIVIAMPQSLTDEQRALWEKLAKISNFEPRPY